MIHEKKKKNNHPSHASEKKMDVYFILFDWNYKTAMYALTIKQTRKIHYAVIHVAKNTS